MQRLKLLMLGLGGRRQGLEEMKLTVSRGSNQDIGSTNLPRDSNVP